MWARGAVRSVAGDERSGRYPPAYAETVIEPLSTAAPALRGRVMMNQDWRDLTFLHWRVDPARVAPLLPAQLRPDVHDGSTWVGLIPFRLTDAALGRGPALPYVGSFPETNVRFYSVDPAGRRGVVFGSLESARLAFVLGARWTLGLNYTWARMRIERRGDLPRQEQQLRLRPDGGALQDQGGRRERVLRHLRGSGGRGGDEQDGNQAAGCAVHEVPR